MPDSPLPGEPLRSGSVDLVTVAVEATLARRAADADETQALLARKQAIWDMKRVQGMSTPQIEKLLREAHLAAGLTEEQLKGEGISIHSIRRITEGGRP